MKYLVQAILIEGSIEIVVDSIKTDYDRATVEMLMKRHRNNSHYIYNVMDIETQELLIHTSRNIYY